MGSTGIFFTSNSHMNKAFKTGISLFSYLVVMGKILTQYVLSSPKRPNYTSAPYRYPPPKRLRPRPFFICNYFGFVLLWFNTIYELKASWKHGNNYRQINYPRKKNARRSSKGCLTGLLDCCTLLDAMLCQKYDLQYFIFHFPGACVYSLINLLGYCLYVFLLSFIASTITSS